MTGFALVVAAALFVINGMIRAAGASMVRSRPSGWSTPRSWW